MKILITGGNGMLGRTLSRSFSADGHEVIIADLPDWDITRDGETAAKIMEVSPDVVVHCAAMTKVDDCESNRELAFKINEDGSRNVALAAKLAGARLFAISTDYVFSGEPPREPWAWSEQDIPRPRTVYGASKAAGEQLMTMIYPETVILRIAWLYGEGGPSFVHTMMKLGEKEGDPLKVVNDQRGNPTSCDTVADVIKFLFSRPDVSGIVHATCEEQCSWYDFAVEIAAVAGNTGCRVNPCHSSEFPSPVTRPSYSVLDKTKIKETFDIDIPHWRESMEYCVKRIKANNR